MVFPSLRMRPEGISHTSLVLLESYRFLDEIWKANDNDGDYDDDNDYGYDDNDGVIIMIKMVKIIMLMMMIKK